MVRGLTRTAFAANPWSPTRTRWTGPRSLAVIGRAGLLSHVNLLDPFGGPRRASRGNCAVVPARLKLRVSYTRFTWDQSRRCAAQRGLLRSAHRCLCPVQTESPLRENLRFISDRALFVHRRTCGGSSPGAARKKKRPPRPSRDRLLVAHQGACSTPRRDRSHRRGVHEAKTTTLCGGPYGRSCGDHRVLLRARDLASGPPAPRGGAIARYLYPRGYRRPQRAFARGRHRTKPLSARRRGGDD